MLYIYLIEIEILYRDGFLDLVNSFGIGASYRILVVFICYLLLILTILRSVTEQGTAESRGWRGVG